MYSPATWDTQYLLFPCRSPYAVCCLPCLPVFRSEFASLDRIAVLTWQRVTMAPSAVDCVPEQASSFSQAVPGSPLRFVDIVRQATQEARVVCPLGFSPSTARGVCPVSGQGMLGQVEETEHDSFDSDSDTGEAVPQVSVKKKRSCPLRHLA